MIRLTIAYDGTGFRGWARQRDTGVRTIEGAMAEVLGHVLREDVRLSVAGRTDAGVHARGQVVSFTTSSGREPEQIQAALNGALAPEVAVVDARVAPPGFDARFSATAREYRYAIEQAPVADPFIGRFVWHRPGELSLSSMREAARSLIGEHDFAAFCRHPGAGRPTVRHLQRLSIRRNGSLVTLDLRANAFLHQMVRSVVGTLVAVGEGRLGPAEVAGILASQDRSRVGGRSAPASGLTLERVVYGRAGRRTGAGDR
ncbi:MAG: tRNA pseudouridine(38-40) synthase TruA [Actinomycetota bacterium]